MKVRREEDWSSLNCPELAAFVLSSITRQPRHKAHAVLVLQPSANEGYEKLDW